MSENTDWRESLPEVLREAPYLKAADSAEDALGKIQHAAKLVGSSIRIPDADAETAEKTKFYERLEEVDGVARLPTHDDIDGVMSLLQKLGYPEEHTGYELPEVDGFNWGEQNGEKLRHYAHEAGLTPGQFQALAERIAKQGVDEDLLADQAMGEQQQALRQDWGDTLEERESLIRGWLDASGAPKSMLDMVNERKLPLETMNWLLSTAKQFKDDVTPISSDGKSPTPEQTPAEIEAEILKVRTDLFNMTETDPRYDPLKQRMVTLHKKLAATRNAA